MKAFSGFFICCLHGSGELLCGKDEKNGGSSQNGGTDISGHIRTGAVVEAGTDLIRIVWMRCLRHTTGWKNALLFSL